MTEPRFLGIDLAWREGTADRPANESGVASISATGAVLNAGWTRGLDETVAWVTDAAGTGPALVFVDAPLIVTNAGGQRECETQVGRRYGRWKVSANTTNLGSPRLAGVRLRGLLEERGWEYADGWDGPPREGRAVSECYPYTTLVGAFELGYTDERPRYKRRPPLLPAAQWRSERAVICDRLIGRIQRLATADPPLVLESHPVARRLVEDPSPLGDTDYKHREDLIDALLCAWTAALWWRHGLARCQVLGPRRRPGDGSAATIIAPAREEQR